MKKFISLITIIGAISGLQAQVTYEPDVDAITKSFYQSEAWAKAFAGSYGVDSSIEPGVPEDPTEREALGQIRTLLQQQSDTSLQSALTAIETLMSTLRAEGKSTSPMVTQIAGTLAMRLSEIVPNQKERYIKQATRYFEQAIKEFPNFLRAHKNLANLLFKNDEEAKAKSHFIKALELGDNDAITYGLLGAIYFEEGNLVSAESAFRNSLMINPKIREFKQMLGNTLLQQERYNEAKDVFTELLAKFPNNTDFWVAQSNCYIALENIDEASYNLEMVRLMGKSNVPSLMLLGDVYMNKEMVNEAADAYAEAVLLGSNPIEIERFISAARTLNSYTAYNQAARIVELIRTEKSSLISEENQIEILTLSSQINIALGKGEEAVGDLVNLLKRDPFNASALLTLADYYSDLKASEGLDEIEAKNEVAQNHVRAFTYFERAQSLEEDEMTQVRAYIGEAMLHVKRDDLKQAAENLEEAQAIRYQDNVQNYLTQIRAALQARR